MVTKLRKIILVLIALITLVTLTSNFLVEAQGLVPFPPPTKKPDPPPTPPPTPPPPPPPKTPTPPPPPPKTPIPPPPPPPPPPKSTTPPIIPPTATTPKALPTTTTDPLTPTSTPDPVPTETTPPLPPPPPISTPIPPPPLPSPPPQPSTVYSNPTNQSTTQYCTTSNDCDPNGMFCNLSTGICQSKGAIGDRCSNNDECSSNFICNKKVCQYRDNGIKDSSNIQSSNIKKAAITGSIVVGTFIVGGFIFFVNRFYQRKKVHKGNEVASSVYSTDDGTDPIYPFAERSNSFSNNKNNNNNNNSDNNNKMSPSYVPTTNLPTGNGGFVTRQGNYYNNNYYNNEYNGAMYMRNNEDRTRNLLQHTRGNVVMAPHAPPHAPPHIPHVPHPPPPHLQPNYNWNYRAPGVPSPPPQQLMVNQGQGGLFPVPAVKRGYGNQPIPNNMKGDNKSDKKIPLNLSENPEDKSKLTLSPGNVKIEPALNLDDKQKKTQNLKKDLLNSNSSNSSASSVSNTSASSTNVESIYDIYARDSVSKSKTKEVKLSQTTNNSTRNTPTIEPEISKDSIQDINIKKSKVTRLRSQTFGHAHDPKILQLSKSLIKTSDDSIIKEQKHESKVLNNINETQ